MSQLLVQKGIPMISKPRSQQPIFKHNGHREIGLPPMHVPPYVNLQIRKQSSVVLCSQRTCNPATRRVRATLHYRRLLAAWALYRLIID